MSELNLGKFCYQRKHSVLGVNLCDLDNHPTRGHATTSELNNNRYEHYVDTENRGDIKTVSGEIGES